MRWDLGRRSSNLEDRRGLPGIAVGGGGGLLLVGVIVALLGGDPTPYLAEGINRTLQSHTQQASHIPKDEQDKMVEFVSVVLGSTEDVWRERFAAQGQTYQNPHLVVFSGATRSACGQAASAMGPFYCPLDQTVYVDLEFFHELATRFNAPGDFAQAYVIAHEIGHHVQNQLGVLDRLQESGGDRQMSVKTELMADCLAGVWAHDTQRGNLLENGDVEEALNAASHIGDDVLQKQTQGYVVPDSFTHGSAQQRYQWFKTGFTAGDMKACDTFNGRL